MRRREYGVQVLDDAGAVVAGTVKYAMNSAQRASESLVRDVARREGQTYERASWERTDHDGVPGYVAVWTGDNGRTLQVRIVGDRLPSATDTGAGTNPDHPAWEVRY